ncbi:ATP-binding protein [Pelagibius sp. Alg239-R121]|uniref:ATP-binding protein n=1 Tax=Pelagibius sp. Alg239-R121 TaxID=2993448 RepID=UPI0024A66D33|nr:ATP-binding protein [Pelagibius sp. Alg239-R121]
MSSGSMPELPPAMLEPQTGPAWNQGISFKLARTSIIIAFMLGLVLSSVQVAHDYYNQIGDLNIVVQRILRVAKAPARRAAYELNGRLAQEVVDGLLEYDFVVNAAIVEVSSGVMAEKSRPKTENDSGWMLSTLFHGTLEYSEALLDAPLLQDNEPTPIGHLELTVDRLVALDPFFHRSTLVIISGVVRSMILAGLLWAVFYFLISRSLVELVTNMRRIDPEAPKEINLSTYTAHKGDEIALLTESFNALLNMIDMHLQKVNMSERALKESESRFRDVAEAASDWFWETDRDGRFSYVSDRFFSIVGIEQEDFIGRSPAVLENPETSETGWLEFSHIVVRNWPFRDHRCRKMGSKGQSHWFTISGKPTFDETGALSGYRGTGSDITNETNSENRMRQAQKMEAVGQLTGGIAHDFNNLLAVILGNLELLLEQWQGKDSRRDLITRALGAVERGASLTQRLLAFSRKQPLDPSPVNANSLVAGMDDLIRRTLGEHIEIELVTAGGLWLCDVDGSQLENALLNLAINARDAMPDGGKLTIETGNARLDDDYADQAVDLQPGQYVLVAVTDTGCGMPQDILDHIFEPFFTTKEIGKGSGLGLSMVYGFAKQSGGHLTTYSEVGEGTTFKLYLPRSQASKTLDLRDAAEDFASLVGNERVLVVEDDVEVRRLTTTILSNSGYRVTAASNGQEALNLLDSGFTPELLLTDAVLPGGMSGGELAGEMKQRIPTLRILFMSGYTENSIVHRGRLDPNTNLLQKPFRKRDLLRKIRSALEHSI